MIAERHLSARRCIIDPNRPAGAPCGTICITLFHRIRGYTCPQFNLATPTIRNGGNRPGSYRVLAIGEVTGFAAGYIGNPGLAQTPAGYQEGHRFQQIGFTGAVWTGEHNGPFIEIQP
jgi:hypothetical protein